MERAGLRKKQKAVFIDRDGTLNVYRGFISSADDIELIPRAAGAIRLLNEHEFRAVIVTNQAVIARGEASLDEVRKMHAKLETLLASDGAYLDAIYFCPHHPDRGLAGEVSELKIECDCRKPEIGMIERAVRDLNLNLSQSWLIGDTTRDMETARRAGLRSILVRTGLAGEDGKYDAAPQFVASDLYEAVNLIVAEREPNNDCRPCP